MCLCLGKICILRSYFLSPPEVAFSFRLVYYGIQIKTVASASYMRECAGNCKQRVFPGVIDPTPAPTLAVPEYTDGLELARRDTDSDNRVQYILPDKSPKELIPGRTMQLAGLAHISIRGPQGSALQRRSLTGVFSQGILSSVCLVRESYLVSLLPSIYI